MREAGLQPTNRCMTSLLAACARAGDLVAARRVFKGMGHALNVPSYTALMDACLKEGSRAACAEAFQVWHVPRFIICLFFAPTKSPRTSLPGELRFALHAPSFGWKAFSLSLSLLLSLICTCAVCDWEWVAQGVAFGRRGKEDGVRGREGGSKDKLITCKVCTLTMPQGTDTFTSCDIRVSAP